MIRLFSKSIILLLFFSCSSGKKSSNAVIAAYPPMKLDKLMDLIIDHQEYKYYSAKGSISYSGSDFEGTAEANLKIIKDSLALLTIKKFGIELFRILIDKDSVCALDRIQNTWEKSSIFDWTKSYSLPIDYFFIQDVITTGFYLTDYLSYELSTKKDTSIILGTSELFQIKTQLLAHPIRPYQLEIIRDNQKASISYRNNIIVDKKYYPNDINLNYQTTDKLQNNNVSIKWNQIILNIPGNIKFEIPSYYSKK